MNQQELRETLTKTIEALKSGQAPREVEFRTRTELKEGVRCEAKIRNFPPVVMDEPPELGGQNTAPNPVEIVLAALGCCQEIMYAAYASMLGIELNSVRVNIRGELDLNGLFALDEDTPAGFLEINYETDLDSPASDEELAKLAELVETHCPVYDTLARPISVKGTVSVQGRMLDVSHNLAA